jgi:hypothetical protein
MIITLVGSLEAMCIESVQKVMINISQPVVKGRDLNVV